MSNLLCVGQKCLGTRKSFVAQGKYHPNPHFVLYGSPCSGESQTNLNSGKIKNFIFLKPATKNFWHYKNNKDSNQILTITISPKDSTLRVRRTVHFHFRLSLLMYIHVLDIQCWCHFGSLLPGFIWTIKLRRVHRDDNRINEVQASPNILALTLLDRPW